MKIYRYRSLVTAAAAIALTLPMRPAKAFGSDTRYGPASGPTASADCRPAKVDKVLAARLDRLRAPRAVPIARGLVGLAGRGKRYDLDPVQQEWCDNAWWAVGIWALEVADSWAHYIDRGNVLQSCIDLANYRGEDPDADCQWAVDEFNVARWNFYGDLVFWLLLIAIALYTCDVFGSGGET